MVAGFQPVCLLGPGGIYGEQVLLQSGVSTLQTSVMTIEITELYFLVKADFARAMDPFSRRHLGSMPTVNAEGLRRFDSTKCRISSKSIRNDPQICPNPRCLLSVCSEVFAKRDPCSAQLCAAYPEQASIVQRNFDNISRGLKTAKKKRQYSLSRRRGALPDLGLNKTKLEILLAEGRQLSALKEKAKEVESRRKAAELSGISCTGPWWTHMQETKVPGAANKAGGAWWGHMAHGADSTAADVNTLQDSELELDAVAELTSISVSEDTQRAQDRMTPFKRLVPATTPNELSDESCARLTTVPVRASVDELSSYSVPPDHSGTNGPIQRHSEMAHHSADVGNPEM